MKFYLKPLLSILFVAILLGYSSCGPGDPPPEDPATVQLGLLTSTWKVGANGDVKLGNVSRKGDYSGFTLVIGGTPGNTSFSYTTSGRPATASPWGSSGTWVFGTDVTKDIIRDKGLAGKELPISYTVTATTLELTFNYQGTGEARTNEVKGQWVFTLTK